jgi:hypothetical protein
MDTDLIDELTGCWPSLKWSSKGLVLNPATEIDLQIKPRDEAWIATLLVWPADYMENKRSAFEVELFDCFCPAKGVASIEYTKLADPSYLVESVAHILAKTIAAGVKEVFIDGEADLHAVDFYLYTHDPMFYESKGLCVKETFIKYMKTEDMKKKEDSVGKEFYCTHCEKYMTCTAIVQLGLEGTAIRSYMTCPGCGGKAYQPKKGIT